MNRLMQEAISFTPQLAALSDCEDPLADPRPAHPGLRHDRAAEAAAGATRAATLSIGSLGVSLPALARRLRARSRRMGSRRTPSARPSTSPGSSSAPPSVELGWVLDPLTAVMLVMVTFVGLLIFIYTTGYMAHDENFTRFFCFLSLFAGAMLGVVIANSLLLLFMCWETRRPHLLPAHRLLVSQTQRRRRREESLHHHAHRRHLLPARHRLALRRRPARCSSTTTAQAAMEALGAHRPRSRSHAASASPPPAPSACSSSAEPPASPASFRSTSGCPTRWKAPRPSPRSSTPPPWSPPASSSSRASIR